MNSAYRPKPIAVIAVACRLPGAKTPEEFWQLISRGKNAVVRVPESRFDRSLYYDPKKGVVGKSYCEKAALIDWSEAETSGGCITEQDIKNSDTVHILLCKVAEELFRNADISVSSLKEKNIGVFLGHAAGSGLSGEYAYGLHIPQVADYLREIDEIKKLTQPQQERIIQTLTDTIRGTKPWKTKEHCPLFAPGGSVQLLQKKFALTGPGMVFNSSCASALQAICHAVMELQLGRIDAALTGGASCFHQDTLILFSAAQSLSSTGTFPFTEKAEGLIPGEGIVLFYLKTLEKAEAEGDKIIAVIPGVGIASDGKGTSLWAPRKEGQAEAMRRAYANPTDIDGLEYIEGHFTSTHLGDKTELDSISYLLKTYRKNNTQKIPVGSVKLNIGHSLELAGAAGLLKVILALQHETIPQAVLSGAELNKEADWQSIPLYPPDKNLVWKKHADNTPRRAGVNAFGIGGLDVHIAIEDYVRNKVRESATLLPSQATVPIAIIGVGTVLPGTAHFESFRASQNSPETFITPLPVRPWNAALFADPKRVKGKTVSIPGGGVSDFVFDWRRHRVPPKQVSQGNPLQYMMLEAADQALRQAGIDTQGTYDHTRTGCIVGSMFGGDFSVQLVMGLRQPETCAVLQDILKNENVAPDAGAKILRDFTALVLKKMPALIDETGSFTASTLASRITKTFNLMGGGVAVDSGNSSGMAALLASADMLLTNACDMMICMAGHHDLSPGAYYETGLSGRIADSLSSATPYSKQAQGTLPGEGCIALLLKRLDDAKRDGNKIYGIINSIGVAEKMDLQKSVAAAVRQSLENATMDADLVSGLAMAGSGIAAIDGAELNGLQEVYNHTLPAETSVSKFGLLGGAAGIVSLLNGIVALESETLYGTTTGEQPLLPSSRIIFHKKPQKIETTDAQCRLFLGINFCTDFGNCYHIILQRGEPVTNFRAISKSSKSFERIANHVIHFDATAKRRERLRSGTAGGPCRTAVSVSNPVTENLPQEAVPSQSVCPSNPAPVIDRAEVEEFLINYVIEQTEYPREMIELDEPLPDFGIDSIKKAQMFGELAECFDVKPRSDLKFEDITTLRQIIDIVTEE